MLQFERKTKGVYKLIFFLGIILFASQIAWAGPRIKFEETTHDFGEVIQGKSASYSFEFKNIGDESLIIEKVKAG